MNTPEWMNKELFQNTLRTYFENKSIEILGFSCKPAVGSGENYTSSVYRLAVTYNIGTNGNKNSISLIVKFLPKDEMLATLAKAINLFEKEIEMFSKTIPKIDEIIGNNGTFSSNCLKVIKEPIPTLILEDISPKGYVMHERHHGLDLEHCMIVLKKIALFHAASVVMYDVNSNPVHELYTEGIYSPTDLISQWVCLGFKSATEAIGRWPGFETYHAKLQRLGDRVLTRSHASWKRRLGGFNVLNHGDLWINNFMFLYESKGGKVKDVKFVDYQLVIHTSPAIDLHYFFTTSCTDEVRAEHLNILLDFYYGHLLAGLTDLKYSLEKVPTRQDFLSDFKARTFYSLVAAVTVTPVIKAVSRKDASFEDLMTNDSEGSFRYHCYNNDVYKATLACLLPYYDNLGILD